MICGKFDGNSISLQLNCRSDGGMNKTKVIYKHQKHETMRRILIATVALTTMFLQNAGAQTIQTESEAQQAITSQQERIDAARLQEAEAGRIHREAQDRLNELKRQANDLQKQIIQVRGQMKAQKTEVQTAKKQFRAAQKATREENRRMKLQRDANKARRKAQQAAEKAQRAAAAATGD